MYASVPLQAELMPLVLKNELRMHSGSRALTEQCVIGELKDHADECYNALEHMKVSFTRHWGAEGPC